MKTGTNAHREYLIDLIHDYSQETGVPVSQVTRDGFRTWVSEKELANASDKVFRKYEGFGPLKDGAISKYMPSFFKKKSKKEEPPEVPMLAKAPESDVYVVTYAQNATPAHKPFLQSLLTYCAENNAKLLVIPGRYKNPTSIWSENQEHDEWWDEALLPYLFNGRLDLDKSLCVYGDISIQPTAASPLSSFEVFAAQSAIFGHPKLQFMTVPTAKRRYPRIYTTTGAATLPNYTKSKAGKKGEAHHIFGATVIEKGQGLFHIRQINALKNGTFIDLDKKYTPTGVEDAGRAKALVCGDIHVDSSDEQVIAATFDSKDSIVNVLKPQTIVYHDVLDFEVRNHHTIDNFPLNFQQAQGDRPDNVEEEVNRAIQFLDEKTPSDTRCLVVGSNHDEAFDKWLQKADVRLDPANARFFHEAWYKLLKYYEDNKRFPLRQAVRRGFTTMGAFKLFYDERGQGRAQFLDREEPVKIGDIYIHFHGDEGLGGSSGTQLTYSKLGVKTIIGHSHRPGIRDGCYQVGVTGSLDMEYNATPSAWLNSHCVIYSNGKRCLINVIAGSWKAD